MLNLPLRPDEIEVEIPNVEGVTIVGTPLTDAETARLMKQIGVTKVRAGAMKVDGEELDAADVAQMLGEREIEMPVEEMFALFRAHATAIRGVQFGGEDFDPKREAHHHTVPVGWKMRFVSKLLAEAVQMPEALRKN